MSDRLHGARRAPLETHLKRFPKTYRKRLRKLAKTSPRLGDLLFAFPGAGFALVSGRGAPQDRGAATRLVKEGAPLPQVAETLALPLWLRRLPPEAFQEPLPENLAPDLVFDRQVVNLVPQAPEAAALWLEIVLAGKTLAGADFALWLAGQKALRRPNDPSAQDALRPADPRLLALYAAVSGNADLVARRFADVTWTRHMTLSRAVDVTRIWLERLVAEYCRSDAMDGAKWLKPQRVAGFAFAPRRTPQELDDEGRVMANCVGSYARKVAHGRCLIYAIRRGGKSVATLEVVPDRNGAPVIGQLEGYANGPAPEKAARAAQTWLARLGPCPHFTVGLGGNLVDRQRWARIWDPVWTALQIDPDWMAVPTSAMFRRAEAQLDHLKRLSMA